MKLLKQAEIITGIGAGVFGIVGALTLVFLPIREWTGIAFDHGHMISTEHESFSLFQQWEEVKVSLS